MAAIQLAEDQLMNWVSGLGFKGGDRILLSGDLGAGKTTLAKVLIASWSETESPLSGSPTFSIAHEYQTRMGRVMHLDLYRLSSAEEFQETGLWDEILQSKATFLVEWVDQIPGLRDDLRRGMQAGDFGMWEIKIDPASGTSTRRSYQCLKLSNSPSLVCR